LIFSVGPVYTRRREFPKTPTDVLQEHHVSDESRVVESVAIDHHHQVVDVFEAYYQVEDRFTTAFNYGRHKIDVMIDEQLKKLAPGSKVLDAGCGTGHYVERFRDQGFDAWGVEPADGMREAAQRRNPPDRILNGVITSLPFPDASFDMVIAIEVFRYLSWEDNERGFAEMMRVLKPGGVAFGTFVNRFSTDGFYVWQRARQLVRAQKYDSKHPHCEFTTPRELEKAFRKAGASRVETAGRLSASLRLVYKASPTLAASLTRKIERYDDLACQIPLTKPFRGHLMTIAYK
jgi:ubiquinone/menaquinone biosynthesis C-methylase UbiE